MMEPKIYKNCELTCRELPVEGTWGCNQTVDVFDSEKLSEAEMMDMLKEYYFVDLGSCDGYTTYEWTLYYTDNNDNDDDYDYNNRDYTCVSYDITDLIATAGNEELADSINSYSRYDGPAEDALLELAARANLNPDDYDAYADLANDVKKALDIDLE